jgi:predicted amidohydrolase YtcJ
MIKNVKLTAILLSFAQLLFAQFKDADALYFNAKIYTVDAGFSIVESMAIKDGKILATGAKKELSAIFKFKKEVNLNGKFVYPGFIDAHAHFYGYSNELQQVNLYETKSWEEIISKLKAFSASHPNGWIIGNGWDQNDWEEKKFPNNTILNTLFPDRPVLLGRVDGHASIANNTALSIAEINPGDKLIGGEVETINGQLTGILIDNAMNAVYAKVPAITDEIFKANIEQAQANCFKAGLTSLNDCGLDYITAERLKKLQVQGDCKIRLNIMLTDSPESFAYAEQNGAYNSDRLTINSIKVLGDGALGSRGACLLKPYSDKPNRYGFLISTLAHYDSVANWCYKNNWQLCTHAIGDSANRSILKIYEKYLQGKNNRRWRIEHAQVLAPEDFHYFGENSVIPSVQPTHATSDMYWAADRLGNDRIKGAYAFKKLLNENGWEALGTDFPVEDISPLKTFYAAVVRKDASGWPNNGFQFENALSREETLRGMTIWAAKASFEENKKGSLEPGKFADFIVLDTDLMQAPVSKILGTKTILTFLNGEVVYQGK